MERVIHTPPGGPPQGSGPNSEIYGIMGEGNIFKMMSDFYKDLGLLEFLIKIRHHLEDVAFAHDSIDFAVGAGPLRRPPGRRMNDPFHLSLILTKVKRISIPLRFAFLFNPDGRYRYY